MSRTGESGSASGGPGAVSPAAAGSSLSRQWPKLTVYLADGRLPIDNNLTENAIRPFVIGRKNFLYIFTDLPQATSIEQIEALLPVPAGDGNLAKAS